MAGSKKKDRDEQETVAVPGQDPRVGDTWEDMHPDPDANGPQRRVGVLSIDGEDVLVENKVTRVKSTIRADRFVPPYWRFIG